jgi:hypothetical protein
VKLALFGLEIKSDPTSKLFRRNFGALTTAALEPALDAVDWSPIYASDDADFIQRFIVEAIITVLDVVCPTKQIVTKKSNDGLYLSRETREVMASRDSTSGKKLKVLRNRVVKLVKRDRIQSTLKSLRDRLSDHRLLWQLANRGLGKSPAALPSSLVTASGTLTSTQAESATMLNTFYIEKVRKLREKLQVHCHPQIVSSYPRSVPNSNNKFFAFRFANETRIAETIRRLKPTKARGVDDIPASILKLGVSVLAAPIASLVNVSLASGVVPWAFKTAVIVPVYKGKGKSKWDPASYRPIALLPSMAKVLEIVVRDDLEAFLASTGALPDTQYGFQPGEVGLDGASKRGGCVACGQGVRQGCRHYGVRLDGGFQHGGQRATAPTSASPRRQRELKELSWFDNYLCGGRQKVVWGDSASDLEEVTYGICQGSCLSPLLFLALVSDMPGGTEITGYADDTCMWSSSSNLSSLKNDLEAKARCFAYYVSSRGLVMNATKTQVMISGGRLPRTSL